MLYTFFGALFFLVSLSNGIGVAIMDSNNPSYDSCVGAVDGDITKSPVSVPGGGSGMGDTVAICVFGDDSNDFIPSDTEITYVWYYLNQNLDRIELTTVGGTYTYTGSSRSHVIVSTPTLTNLWKRRQVLQVGEIFTMKFYAAAYINNIEIGSSYFNMVRPVQSIGFDTAATQFVVRLSRPTSQGNCESNDDASALAAVAASGGTVYVCTVFNCPFAGTDVGETEFSFVTVTSIETRTTDRETYGGNLNHKSTFSSTAVVIAAGESSITITPNMHSFGKDTSGVASTYGFQ